MEIAQIIKTLGQHRVALALTFAFAVFAALFATHRIQVWPLSVEKRSIEYGAAAAQLLVDSPRSSLVDLQQDTAPLATRAALYAQFMRSNTVREGISKETGIPASLIVAQGPFTTLGGRQNITRPSEARSNEVLKEGDTYRLVFDYQQDLPIMSIYAQAPTADGATKLANGAVAALRTYVANEESSQNVPAERRTVVRELGPAEGGWVNAGVNPLFMAIAFIAALIGGCLLILAKDALKRALGRSRERIVSAPTADESVPPPRPRTDDAAFDFTTELGSRPEAVGLSRSIALVESTTPSRAESPKRLRRNDKA